MARFGNHPVDLTERPPFKPSVLGPSLYSDGEVRYRIGHNSMTIYSYETKVKRDDVSDDEEPENIIFGDAPPDVDLWLDNQLLAQALPDIQAKMKTDAKPSEESVGDKSADAVPSTSAQPSASVPARPLPPLAYWAKGKNGGVPRNALRVGRDLDGGALFVGRVCVTGDLLAGKVAQRHEVCYVAHEGRELAFDEYEVLVLERGHAVWELCANGSFPFDAFPAGITLQGQRVYSARACVNGTITPGRLVVGESECRISYNMKEFRFPEYEVLAVRALDPRKFGGALRYASEENAGFAARKKPRHEDPDDNYPMEDSASISDGGTDDIESDVMVD